MSKGKCSNINKKYLKWKSSLLIFSLILSIITMMFLRGTVAYLATYTQQIKNIFNPSKVTCEVTETFDGNTKKDVNVLNTSDINAFVRVKLISYRVVDRMNSPIIIGGVASIPDFTPGEGWFEKDGFYYYRDPVAPQKSPIANLISSIILEDNYEDIDGGRQVIEVMAEAIQAEGIDSVTKNPAVTEAWGVTVTNGKLSPN